MWQIRAPKAGDYRLLNKQLFFEFHWKSVDMKVIWRLKTGKIVEIERFLKNNHVIFFEKDILKFVQ